MESKIERRCSSCLKWNVGRHENCTFCKVPISPEKIIEFRDQIRQEVEEQKPLDKVDIYLKKLKEHPNFIIRVIFKIIYSTWVVFMLIVSAIVYVVALTPG